MKQNKQEIWRDIPNYKGYYEVSNQGRVRSLDRWVIFKNGRKQFYKGKILEGSDNGEGYKKLNLSKGGKQEYLYIHKLVAICFLGHIPNGNTLVVDHINGIRSDNRTENLQIVTHRDNTSTCHRKDRNSFTSNFVGVDYFKPAKKFRANIQFNSKAIYLGYFDNEIDAAKAYQKALAKINDGTFKIEDYKPKWTSKYKGVSFNKNRQDWLAQPIINGKRIYLGYHTSELEAYQAILEFEAIQPILI